MSEDPGLTEVRRVRERISREHGNDVRKLAEFLMEYQKQFADRLIWAPTASDPENYVPDESDEAA